MSVHCSGKADGEKRSDDLEAATNVDWELVDPERWWRTPYSSVSWSYVPQDEVVNKRVALPPYLWLSSLQTSPTSSLDPEDVALNPDHVGCKVGEAAVASYERDVGFGLDIYPTVDRKSCGLHQPLNLSLSEEDAANWIVRWKETVNDFKQVLDAEDGEDGESSLSSSITESTRSAHSADYFAMPATPVTKASYANVLLKNVSPSSSIPDDSHPATPSKSLNAYASSFVPSSEASGLSSFTFPTLNPPNKSTTRLTTVKIKKDDHGFFTDAQVEDPPRSLPSFLHDSGSPRRRTRTSKTREIVDRLRSSQADTLAKCISQSPSPIFHDLSFIQPRLSVSEDGGDRDRESSLSTPSLEDDDEGWIDVGVEVQSSTKAKRARDLFLALTRRRTDSISSDPSKEDTEDKTTGYPSPHSSPYSEGWIEGPTAVETSQPQSKPPAKQPSAWSSAKSQRKKQHVAKSSVSSSIPSTSVSPTHPTFPPTAPSPYMAVPMLSPSQLGMMGSPAPAPVPYFFTPGAPPYHAMPLSYVNVPGTFLAPSPFVSVPLHPMAPAGYGVAPKGKMNGAYPSYHQQPRKLPSGGGHPAYGNW
ncbi:hypothetical protein D9611_003749 [Ephemerocybe angulata]|uniref:Uncharacterized protein n=1 Tax=Ephemerocybe angulata TaxID=980116 RepID=A0A8H5B702_9AGAR|nr:hypothetical protein D9611_003749 [Tulosesus angulatus]